MIHEIFSEHAQLQIDADSKQAKILADAIQEQGGVVRVYTIGRPMYIIYNTPIAYTLRCASGTATYCGSLGSVTEYAELINNAVPQPGGVQIYQQDELVYSTE